MATIIERRDTRRHQIEVPVHFENGQGISRDISLNGIYFTTGTAFEAGENFKFAFELDYAIPGKSLQLDCRGEILRVENRGAGYGVAAIINEITYLH